MSNKSEAFLNWALDWKGEENVFMSNFVNLFGLYNRESATLSFQELILSSRIPQKRRENIQEASKDFRDHYEETFWAKRSLQQNTELTAIKAACAVQDAGLEVPEERRTRKSAAEAVPTQKASATMPAVLPSPTKVQPDDETGDSEVIEGDEKLKLLAMIEKAKHTVCEHCLNSDKESACTCLKSLDRKLRIMLETLIEELPMKEDRSISESTFVANYVSPILRGMLGCEKVSVQFPNTSSEAQRELGLKADRPDIIAKTKNSEILYGEVTGLSQEHS
ncbi:hypothetical protein BGZ46_004208 [Entomortierella lignicola]|nr:hypothetical protein BGZ46_004208 [Entomortierella lignicola]